MSVEMNNEVSELNRHQLVLASGSPRRKELMEQFCFDFKVIVPDDAAEAGVSESRSPENFVLEASWRKAAAVAVGLDQAVVIAADTIAVCHGQRLGKPLDREHARQMLGLLNRQRHRVLTGVTVWHRPSNEFRTWLESAELQMDAIDAQQLESYLDSGDWIGKAGAFGYQDGLDWVRIVSGLESTVVGLPVECLADRIRCVTASS